MGSKDYTKIIIERLLSKYNNRVMKGTSTGRRIILKPTEVYTKYADNNADMAEKQSFNEAVGILLGMGVVTADYLKFSTDIEKVYLLEDRMETIYDYLKVQYGVKPQSTVVKQLKEMLAGYGRAGELVENYREAILQEAKEPGARIDLVKIKENLDMLKFLEENEENLYVREASMLVYGDSKWFEKNNYDEICSIARNTLGVPKEEDERNDTVLAYYHITPTEQEIFIKGEWKIEWDDFILETKKLQGGIAIAFGDVQGIRKITVHSPGMMTIENKTSYQRMNGGSVAKMYLGGFANRCQIQFLLKVIHDNPYIEYCHFGDIDIGGFLIHRHLCRMTSRNFVLYCMGTDQLRDARFRHCLKELTDYDRKRLESLLEEEPYSEVVKYMKEYNVKLEQEIVSYYLWKGQIR